MNKAEPDCPHSRNSASMNYSEPGKSPGNPGRQPKTDGKLSQFDATVKVLTKLGEPMTTGAMIDAMAAKG